MPFELNPDLPPEGKDQAKHLAEVYGRSPEEVAAMRAQMQATAERAGFPMDWTGEGEEPPAMMWNTFDAHKLLRWALAESGAEAQTRLKLALLQAHFQQRRNVERPRGAARYRRSRGLRPLPRPPRRSTTRPSRSPPASRNSAVAKPGSTRSRASSSTASILIQGAREPADYANMLRQVAGLVQNA